MPDARANDPHDVQPNAASGNRPNDPQWTPEQLAVIHARDANLVVSASAGSGKTAVLTERVYHLITGGHPDGPRGPIPLGRLLIITFTEKAAAEMRDRVERRLKKALEDHPGQEPVIEAINALPGAWIMTIDAFCRRVVVENFHRAGVAPGARVPETRELAQLEREALDRLFEERLASERESERMRETIRAHEKGVQGLQADLRALTRFLQSLDDPAAWLGRERERIGQTLTAKDLTCLPDAAWIAEAFRRATRDLAAMHRQALAQAEALPGGPDAEKTAKLAAWREQIARLETWAQASLLSPGAMRASVAAETAPILGKLGNKGVCGKLIYEYDNKEFAKGVLKPAAKAFDDWRKRWLALDDAKFLQGERLAAERAEALLDLAEGLLNRLDELKRRRGLISFNDYERLALQILSDPKDVREPSEVAHGYRDLFAEVLVDEYQDTSPLQDAIIRRVSRWNDPVPGHASPLFVVGDYKQSIYRFRYADPRLFLELLEASRGHAATASGGPGAFRNLPLHRNFRSRAGLIEFINTVFTRLMDAEVGEVAYGDGEALAPNRVDPPGVDPTCVEACWLLPPERSKTWQAQSNESDASIDEGDPDEAEDGDAASDSSEDAPEALENIEAQATWIARRIRELTDPETGLRPAIPSDGNAAQRPPAIRPGDCAILIRSVKSELSQWVRALDREGIATHVQGIDPLLESQALQDLLAALRLADNPLQDEPLAAILRSPLAGLNEDELMAIRLAGGEGAFHEAFWRVAGRPLTANASSAASERRGAARPLETCQFASPELSVKIQAFFEALDHWRRLAMTRPAEEVLDAILRETGHAAWMSGQPDAAELLRGVDGLRELLRNLGTPGDGRNPLAAFLEQVDEALEAQEAVGEATDPVTDPSSAVHLLTIHRAKGLQFPVVFLPRLERPFHASKQSDMLLDRDWGLGLRGIDPERRLYYETLRREALEDVLRRKERSEELRLLYVALTRAKERVVLVGRPGSRAAFRRPGRDGGADMAGQPLGTLERLKARSSPLSLLGPIVEALAARPAPPAWLSARELSGVERDAPAAPRPLLARALARGGMDAIAWAADWAAAVDALQQEAGGGPVQPDAPPPLPTLDPTRPLCALPGKTTVTELLRSELAADMDDAAGETGVFAEEECQPPAYLRAAKRLSDARPSWLQAARGARRLTGAQRGTLMHQALARVRLTPAPAGAPLAESLRAAALEAIRMAGLLAPDRVPGAEPPAPELAASQEAEAILGQLDLDAMAWFFTTEPGQRMLARPNSVFRELPFTSRKPVFDFSVAAGRAFPDESVLVQGIVDVVLDEGDRATVLDYKTDRVAGGRAGTAAWAGAAAKNGVAGNAETIEALTERYRLQVGLYARAIQGIWRLKETPRAGLVFLDARHVAWI